MLDYVLPLCVIVPPLAYGLFSLACARAYFSRPASASTVTLPVTILKPVKGMDAESFENFASFCRQEYPAPWQIVFAVALPDDPAIPVIRRLMSQFPERDIELVVDGIIHGPNYKISSLINASPMVRHEIIIISDSDIRVSADYLRNVVAPFADPQVGLVTSLYRSAGVQGAPTALEAMGFAAELVPNVMVALKVEGLSFALGASMAVRREALAAIGGFAALVNYLADDYQLGNKVHRAGYRLELSACIVESVSHREDLATVLSRQLRWSRSMRASRPKGYFSLGMTMPVPLACLAIILSGFSPAGWAAAVLLYAVRSCIVTLFSRRYLKDGIFPRWLWLLPIRDLVAFATWALSFLGDRVQWRGHLFRLLPGGRIEEIISVRDSGGMERVATGSAAPGGDS